MVNSIPKAPLVPGKNCFVARSDDMRVLGVVTGHVTKGENTFVNVQWGAGSEAGLHRVQDLRNGFRENHVVQDAPLSNTRKTLGTGTVRAWRHIAGRDLVLVQWHSTGDSRWVPYEHLVRLRDSRMKYERLEATDSDSAERFRLKALAYALDSWNRVTGALDRLDVDPLPHQIDLVHRLLTSDQLNWLIADDVGLGKTIEVGLLLAALRRRRQARRVLIVCPAGIVRQWQDEMWYKFNEDYRIYGSDFNIGQPFQWSGFDKVIVSIDRAKSERHSPTLIDSGEWDVIVFDEAHHLSKIEGQATTQRYRLAEELRRQTDAFIFLTGTPHQGNTPQFINLLRLLRPDLSRRLASVYRDPMVVAEIVLRNRKILATDKNGEFLFRGQDTHLVETRLSESAQEFKGRLEEYLRHGYSASEAGGVAGRAIGFVMTTYRKLASSSIAAIERGLQRRLARLQGSGEDAVPDAVDVPANEMDDAFREGEDGRDDLDRVADVVSASSIRANPFFSGEQAAVAGLLKMANEVKRDDCKLQQFLKDIVSPLRHEGQKVLIFTEYRATQEYLVDALGKLYPDSGIAQINGGMSLDEKRKNIARFNDDTPLMVSTEAGGEGINLHEQCHIMVNYDLPWNPGRLVQRAGRLYRYGQQQRVIVFNLTADDSFDNRALYMMLSRVYTIARDMAQISDDYRDGLETEIIGELLERVDIAALLADNRTMDSDRTDAEIVNAVARAREAMTQQEKLFAAVESYDPQAKSALYEFGPEDILVFLEGILPYANVIIRDRLYNGLVLELELPDDIRGQFSEFPERATVVRVTADRRLAMRLPNAAPMDFKSPFFSHLIDVATSPEFRGEYAGIAGPAQGALGLYELRWQNDQGFPTEEMLLPVFLPVSGSEAIVNPDFFGSVILNPIEGEIRTHILDGEERRMMLTLLDERASAELANRCTAQRHPNDFILLAAADLELRGRQGD